MCKTHYSVGNTYGLSVVQLQVLYDRGCEICGKTDDLAIDHNHSCCPVGGKKKCGKCNRGVLCRPCNMALGSFNDDKDLVQKAVDYLTRSMI